MQKAYAMYTEVLEDEDVILDDFLLPSTGEAGSHPAKSEAHMWSP